MTIEFPLDLLPLTRCPEDGGDLHAAPDVAGGLSEGAVRCAACGASYAVRDGVLDLLGEAAVPAVPESRHELAARDREAADARGGPGYREGWVDELESGATLRSLGSAEGARVLEVGSGAGFYTRRLASLGARVLAVDFSMAALRINARTLPGGARVALVRADVTHFAPAPAAFDLALNTAYSNLSTAALRRAANVAVRRALRPGGRYLVSAHHQHLRRRLRREPEAARYPGSGIFFQCFTRASLRAELAPVFEELEVRPAAVWIPLLSGVPALRGALSRLCEALPGPDALGLFLLAAARRGPLAEPAGGAAA